MSGVREKLSVSKREKQKFDMERPNHKKLSEVKIKGTYLVKISKYVYFDLENLHGNVGRILCYLKSLL
jgi:hypothetical protein